MRAVILGLEFIVESQVLSTDDLTTGCTMHVSILVEKHTNEKTGIPIKPTSTLKFTRQQALEQFNSRLQ
jgi:hypothetical protein